MKIIRLNWRAGVIQQLMLNLCITLKSLKFNFKHLKMFVEKDLKMFVEKEFKIFVEKDVKMFVDKDLFVVEGAEGNWREEFNKQQRRRSRKFRTR